VDERRASPLTFNVLANGFLACISTGAAERALTPQRPFLPEMLFQLFFVSLPKLNGRFLFQSPHDSQWRDSRFAFHQAMNMILIHFERDNQKNLNAPQFLQTTSLPHFQRRQVTFCGT
jgi:hypothetical protein